MNPMETGKAIAFLRKREGYTQKSLASKLGVSDKAVSKWERGLGSPDVSLLAKLSILLDTDIESLLEGNVSHYEQLWRGILFLYEKNQQCEIFSGTYIYDKPLVYYLLSNFLLVGIRDILVICNEHDQSYIKHEFKEINIGVKIFYYQPKDDECLQDIWKANQYFVSNYNIAVSFGKTLLYGLDLTKYCQHAMARVNKSSQCEAVMLLLQENENGKKYIVDVNRRVKAIVNDVENLDKNSFEISSYSGSSLIFISTKIVNSIILRCESILELLNALIIENTLYAEIIGRGMIKIDINLWDDIIDASNLVKILQKRSGEYISCIEEIAWRRGLITLKELQDIAKLKENPDYREYLLKLSKN